MTDSPPREIDRAQRRRELIATARQELLDGLRGRRQLVVRALTPIVLFGVVLGASLATRGADPTRETPYRVAVQGDLEGMRTTIASLDKQNLAFEPTGDAALATANGADIGLVVPNGVDLLIKAREPVALEVIQTTVSPSSRAATANLRAGLAEVYRGQMIEARDAANQTSELGTNPPGTTAGTGTGTGTPTTDPTGSVDGTATLQRFTIDRINVQRTQAGTRELSAQIVPALIVLQAAMLVNGTATRILGRNNRGLIMAQLLLPLRRTDLARAKAIAELGLGLTAASPVLAVIIGYAAIAGNLRAGLGAGLVAAGATAVVALVLSAPMVACGLFIGTAARSQEHVTLGTAISLILTSLVAAVTALGEFPRPAGIAVVPIVGAVSALRDILNGGGGPTALLVACLSALALTALFLRLAARVFDAERTVLRVA